jgi:POT family proton-dependent oligopeptide transporter
MGRYPWMVTLAGDFDVRPEHAGLLGVFGGLAIVLFAFGLALWAISGRAVEWMHGAEKTAK